MCNKLKQILINSSTNIHPNYLEILSDYEVLEIKYDIMKIKIFK